MDDKEFCLKDYELKIQYLTSHFDRMWQRFNFFLVIEMGLSAAIWGWVTEFEDSKYGWTIILIGLLSSLCWYIFGAQDRYLVEVYRKAIQCAWKKVNSDQNYHPVGSTKIKVKKAWYQWRSENISTTKLAAIFPLLVSIYWGSLLIINYIK